jgi:hypothetical protein
MKKYLTWAEKGNAVAKHHLPDIFLDMNPYGHEESWVTTVSDIIPMILFFGALVLCILTKDIEVFSITLLNQSFLVFWNAICEYVTVPPSSYGYDRCLDYLGIKSPAEYKFTVNISGSCVSMLWSGHTSMQIIGTFALCTVLARHYGFGGLLRKMCNGNGPEGRTVAMWFAAVVEAVLLLLDKGHYTVDILLALIITTLTLTNASLRAYESRIFIKQATFVAGLGKEDYDLLPLH